MRVGIGKCTAVRNSQLRREPCLLLRVDRYVQTSLHAKGIQAAGGKFQHNLPDLSHFQH